jgi:hypothetical protein
VARTLWNNQDDHDLEGMVGDDFDSCDAGDDDNNAIQRKRRPSRLFLPRGGASSFDLSGTTSDATITAARLKNMSTSIASSSPNGGVGLRRPQAKRPCHSA